MNSNNPTSNPFKRKTATKGFNNFKALDEFIQNSLDKYQFVDPHQEMYEVTGVYSKLIVSNKSAIPDIVIWNKKFNKNECFVDADTKEYNAFPRLKFILKSKAPPNASEGTNSSKLVVVTKNNIDEKIEVIPERRDSDIKCFRKGSAQIEEDDTKNYEEEDPLWGEVDVTELKNMKVKFQALPGKQGLRGVDFFEEDEKIEGIMENNNNIHDKEVEINHNEAKIGEPANNFTEKVIDKNSLFDFTLVFTHESNNDNPVSNISSAVVQPQADHEKKEDALLKISQNDIVILGNTTKSLNKPIQETTDVRMNKPQQISEKELIKLQKNLMPHTITPPSLGGQVPMIGIPPFFLPSQNLPNPEMLMRGNMNMNMMGIPMPFAPNNSTNFTMPQMTNSNQMNNLNPIMFPFQREEPKDEEEEEDNELFIGNMNLNYNNINPIMFLEDPGLIIQKNLFQKGWFLMSKENKIIGNFSSLDLLSFLEDRFRNGVKMDTFSVTDYETDIYFTPANLYEILRESVPRLMSTILGKKTKKDIPKNFGKIHMNIMIPPQMIPNTNLPGFSCFQGGIPPSQIPTVGNLSRGIPNYNINVQYVKNDININSFGYPLSQVQEINGNRNKQYPVASQKSQGAARKTGKGKKQ